MGETSMKDDLPVINSCIKDLFDLAEKLQQNSEQVKHPWAKHSIKNAAVACHGNALVLKVSKSYYEKETNEPKPID